MRTACPIALAVLVGCGGSGLDPQGVQVRILDVEPEEGPVQGGTPVTITGLGFDPGAVAWFDDVPLPTTRVDQLTLTLTTPAWAGPGPVEVRVTTEKGAATLPDGFTYTGGGTTATTGTSTTTPTGTGTEVAPTGLTGGLVQYVLTQVACMDCFPGWFATDVDVWAEAALHDGVDDTWLANWPAVGSCVANPTGGAIATTTWDGGASVQLTTGATSVTLDRQVDPDGFSYGATGLTLGDFEHPATWDLVVPGGADIGPTTVSGAVQTPEGFATLAPVEMLYVNPAAAFSARFSRTSGQDITWSPTGFDTVNVTLLVFSSDGQQTLGAVMCVDNDDGSLHVPAAWLSAYPAGSLVGVFVYRTQTTEAVIPANGHTLEGVAQMGVFGTGIVSP